ncbi:hypothetical protein Angca_007103 [Angiostrongylus cantonensis]|nr:hypothetical protein Angca_007103 [Angiostrongylus cantonensis]
MEEVAFVKAAKDSKIAERKEKIVEVDCLPQLNDDIQGDEKKYNLKKVLGEGGYGTVFLSQDGAKLVAVKTEKFSTSMLHADVGVLKAAKAAKAKHFCELLDYGLKEPHYAYMVMSLLYKDLHKLRYEMPNKRFSISTSLRLSMQSLKAIEELHKLGYVSCDIKPGNFAPGHRCNKQSKIIFLYDFGLSKRYIDKKGKVIPARKDVGWRGTTRYASLTAHSEQDLGRRDDLESWFYMIVEMTRGMLPWRFLSERNEVYVAKQTARAVGRKHFLYETPKQFDRVLTTVDSYSFESQPEYDKIYRMLEEVREEKGIRLDERWDWEGQS